MFARTTTLESFRRMLYNNPDNETAYDTEKSFLESLKGEFKGNDMTVIGTAFHSIVERGETVCDITASKGLSPFDPDDVRVSVEVDGKTVVFNQQQFDVAIAYRDRMRGALHEVPARRTFTTRHGDITVFGTADLLHGIYIRDIKTRFSRCVQQDYIDSYQWRFYLSLFEMRHFVYDVFEFRNYIPEQGINVTGCPIAAHEPIECAAYAAMEADLTALLNDFLEYVRFRGLEEYVSKTINKYDEYNEKNGNSGTHRI
jgi:hypothetical protein